MVDMFQTLSESALWNYFYTKIAVVIKDKSGWRMFNPLRPNSDLSQTSHCNIKCLSVSEIMRIENMITLVTFY